MVYSQIAQFKARLSSYLQEVRQGREVIIMDRKTPIAKVVPFSQSHHSVVVRGPRVKKSLKSLTFPGIKARVDVVRLLREARGPR